MNYLQLERIAPSLYTHPSCENLEIFYLDLFRSADRTDDRWIHNQEVVARVTHISVLEMYQRYFVDAVVKYGILRKKFGTYNAITYNEKTDDFVALAPLGDFWRIRRTLDLEEFPDLETRLYEEFKL